MRDEHDRAAVFTQKGLEPEHRLDVEMVRRFVQEQQIRLSDERAGEQHAAPPTARQRRHNRVARQAEPRHDHMHAGVDVPLIDVFNPGKAVGDHFGYGSID